MYCLTTLATILYPARVHGPRGCAQLGTHVLAVAAGLDHRDDSAQRALEAAAPG
jgi:hypothetical protein